MSKNQQKPNKQEAKMLAEYATHTRFTWAIIFLAFVAGLIGLLPIIKPYEPFYYLGFNVTLLFYAVLFLAYFFLTFGLSYSFYAIWRTSFNIEYLRNIYESQAVKAFSKKHWKVCYAEFFRVERNNEVEFRKSRVVGVATIMGIGWILLFFLKFVVG